MTMTIDTANQHRFGPGIFNYGPMSSYSNHPHFTNPFATSSSTAAGQGPHGGSQSLYVSSHEGAGLPHLNLNSLPKHQQQSNRTGGNVSMAGHYGSLPVSAGSAGSAPMADALSRQHDLLPMPQDLLSLNRLQHPATTAPYDTSAYTTAASPVNATYGTSPTPYDQLGYAPAPLRGSFASLAPEDTSRRYSQQGLHQPDDRRSFQDALEASHGMLSMSQDTPRNIYDVRARQRGSQDSYGFPSAHSATSSISSTGFSPYYGGSVDGSVSDYSTTGSDIESLSGRGLSRAPGLMSNQPPAPQSMMSSFSSKVSSSTQKKHKCKVCDKRFTRPSSLQTHMYSHTGEKPYTCEVEGCGRNFSVVSNLRRHKKVHKNHGQADTPSETGSEDHQSE
ncbi:C2H2 zinc finger protein encoded by the fle1 protein [Podospora australis]|uniref:C2H2 zinc finger protein encoded by the fle1 protein n=1 Tax=Podospora australis TaxID=1536484 RepID=A0AAN7AKP1_9PEZI|nr:C2H2 zinc finger protein encoded by the fle1 protein [Podospora australis]